VSLYLKSILEFCSLYITSSIIRILLILSQFFLLESRTVFIMIKNFMSSLLLLFWNRKFYLTTKSLLKTNREWWNGEYKPKAPYIGGAPENKHLKKHTWGQHPPKYTSPPKSDSFTKATTVKAISHITHRHYSPPTKHPSKLNSQSSTPKLSHIRKDQSTSNTSRPPVHQKKP